MRSTFLLLLASLAAGGLLLMNARRAPSKQPNGKSVIVSQHDWAKQALDRTAEVKRQVAKQRKDDALPNE